MFFRRKIMIAATLSLSLGLGLWSCTSDLSDGSLHATNPELSKIANSSADAQQGMLIVRFSDESIAMLENHARHSAETRSAATRSGISEVDCILDRIGVSSFRRVFPEGRFEDETRAAGLHRWYVLQFPADVDLDKAAAELASAAEVSTIQYNTRVYKAYDSTVYPAPAESAPTRANLDYPFNDPQLFWQWHYVNNADIAISESAVEGADVNLAEAWKYSAGDPRVIVAIVDGGVKYSHPDLAANMWVNEAELYGEAGKDSDGNGYVDDIYGYNFVTDSGQITWSSEGDDSHGTHVAGTVAAVNNNGVGVCGVAGGTGHHDGVRIMSCQIFAGMQDSGDYQTALAIKYAADMGASILQCSYGMTVAYYSDEQFESIEPLVVDALKYFMNKKGNCDAIDGGLVIYASGNNGQPASSYPGAYRDVISVTAFGVDYLPAYYTNYNKGCNIAAPGGEISGGNYRGGVLSTVCSETDSNGDDYGYIQGTSMACPHVSGVAALGLSYALKRGKHFSREEFTSMLLTSVNDIDSYMTGYKNNYGSIMDLENEYRGRMGTGAVDAYRLMMQVEGTPCITLAAGEESSVELDKHFGGGAENLTYVEGGIDATTDLLKYGAEMSADDAARLGVEEKPYVSGGKLHIKCDRTGCAKIKIRAIAGGTEAGTSGSIGGIPVVKEIAVVVRATKSDRWL